MGLIGGVSGSVDDTSMSFTVRLSCRLTAYAGSATLMMATRALQAMRVEGGRIQSRVVVLLV